MNHVRLDVYNNKIDLDSDGLGSGFVVWRVSVMDELEIIYIQYFDISIGWLISYWVGIIPLDN